MHVHEIHEDPTCPTIDEAAFVRKLKVWSELTTASPSGLHLGGHYYTALIARHQYSEDEPDTELVDDQGVPIRSKRDEWDEMQQELRNFHLNLINYALGRGYSYQQWQSIMNMVSFKEEDNIRIHRMREIHIYEAYFNLVLGLKWRVALYQVKAVQALNGGQYRSRPRRNAIGPIMIEELQFKVSRLSRRMFLQTNYDATAC